MYMNVFQYVEDNARAVYQNRSNAGKHHKYAYIQYPSDYRKLSCFMNEWCFSCQIQSRYKYLSTGRGQCNIWAHGSQFSKKWAHKQNVFDNGHMLWIDVGENNMI